MTTLPVRITDAYLLTSKELDSGTSFYKATASLATQYLNKIPYDTIDLIT